MTETTGKSLGVALHTDIVGDVVERRDRGENGVIESRHADYFLDHGIRIICEHVIGDTFETLCFPTRRVLQGLFPPEFYTPSFLKHNLSNLLTFLDDIDESKSKVVLIKSGKDFEEVISGGKLGIVLCFQGCSPLENEASLLSLYYRLGVRILNLSSALVPNLVVGHALDKDPRGLSSFGERVLEEASNLGMIVDISGCSEKSFWEVYDKFSGLIIASTSNCRQVYSRPNNLSDDQIRAISERGGVVGVIFNTRSAGERSVDAVVRHVNHIADVAGFETAALGPNIVEERMYPKETYERVFQDVGFWKGDYPTGLESFAGIDLVCEGLAKIGWGEDQINAFQGGNAYRVLNGALK